MIRRAGISVGVLFVALAIQASSATSAGASTPAVSATFRTTVATFNTWWNGNKGSFATRGTKADAEAARLTIAISKLKLTPATTPKLKLGKALALQAFAKMETGCNKWSAYMYDLIADPDPTAEPASSDDDAATNAFTAARPLLATAAKQLGVKIVLFKFA